MAVVGFVAVVTGCGGSPRYDARLVAADSLMHDLPDSALALVQAVDTASVPHEGDRAYRDLLLTQARYRCYITATSDSAINRALTYYRHHDGEREKLTRAYIYKGAVMEELGHPDSAMLYYKHAEATASPTDYFNLGQINVRIGNLYRIHHVGSQTCFEKYQSALRYFKLTSDKKLQLICLFNMAMYGHLIQKKESKCYLSKAIELATEQNDSLNLYRCYELKCRQLLYNGNTLKTAKLIATQCLTNYSSYIDNDLLLDLAELYIKDKMADSAEYYLSLVDENRDIGDEARIRLRKNDILSSLAVITGNDSLRISSISISNATSDSIMNQNLKHTIVRLENDFNNNNANHISHDNIILKWTLAILALSFLLLLILLLAIHFKRLNHVKSIIREAESVSINKHESLLERIDEQTIEIEQFIKNLVSFMQLCVKAESQTSTSEMAQIIKATITNAANAAFWHELRVYLDKNHNNIISRIAKNANLNENDLKFIELHCCGFNYLEIALTMGYAPNYISTKRKSISKKLGLNTTLQDYIHFMMQNS